MALDPTKDPNFSFLQRLSGNAGPIKILISKKPKEAQAVPRSKSPEGLRRPQPHKKIHRPQQGGGIEWFDMGLLADGTTLNYNVKPTMNITYFPITNSVSFTFDDFTLAHHQGLWTRIMSEADDNPENLVDTFKKVEGPEHGIIAWQGRGDVLVTSGSLSQVNKLDTNNPEWRDNKKFLKSLDQKLLYVSYGGANYFFDSDDTDYKLTETMDFDDPDLDITTYNFKKPTRIFMVPQVGFLRMSQRFGSGADYRHAYLFGHWGIRPREVFLPNTVYKWNESSPHQIDIPVFEGYSFVVPFQSHDPEMFDVDEMDDPYVDQLSDYIKTLPEAELWVQRHDNPTLRTFGFESLSNYPFTVPSGPPDYRQATYQDFKEADTAIPGNFGGFGSDDGLMYDEAGLLIAILQQDSEFRYVWWNGSGSYSTFWDSIQIRSTPE